MPISVAGRGTFGSCATAIRTQIAKKQPANFISPTILRFFAAFFQQLANFLA
jgi:hypothetical protein